MRRLALQRANQELRHMREAYECLRIAQNFDQAERYWSGFLDAHQRVYNRLSAGKTGHPASVRWMIDKLRERRDDPLLQYLHQARHADEHGLVRIAEPDLLGQLHVPLGAGGMHVQRIELGPGRTVRLEATSLSGEPVAASAAFTIIHLRVVAVENRGVRYDTPEDHLGRVLTRGSLIEICHCALEYTRTLLSDANRLIAD